MQFLFYMLLVAAIGYFAKSKGRSPIGWALIALFISPLIAGIILFFLKNLNTGRYDGDTIDTTARPVPDESPRRAPDSVHSSDNKPKVDVDESIRRMEEKLSQGKSEDKKLDVPTALVGAASVGDDEQKVDEHKIEVEETTKSEVVENEVLKPDVEENQVLEAKDVEQNTVSHQGFCESCGQPLSPGSKFCTNCGAPVAK